MNLSNVICEIDDVQVFYDTESLLQLCEYYQKELSMRIYMENMGYYMEDETPPPDNTSTTDNGQTDAEVEVGNSAPSQDEQKQPPAVVQQQQSGDNALKQDVKQPDAGENQQPQNQQPETGEEPVVSNDDKPNENAENNTNNQEPGFLQKIIDTVKKIFMWIPNLITKCIEKIVDKKLAESKQEFSNIVDNMSDQEIDTLLQKIEAKKGTQGGGQPPTTDTETPVADQPSSTVPTGEETKVDYSIHDFRSFDEIYQELGTAFGAVMGAKGARTAASNEIARQNVMASATGQDNLSDAELAKRSALGMVENGAKKVATTAAKAGMVAGATALGGSGLVLTGVGLLAGIGAGKLWDFVSNKIKDARDKNKITQLPRYELIEKACQSSDQELSKKIQLLQQGIPKSDPNAPKPDIKQSLQNILQNFTLVEDKESEQTIRVMNLWYEKFVKPSALFATPQQTQVSNITPEEDQAMSECERFVKDMNDQTMNPLLTQLKQKSEQLVNWFNDPSNPIFGMQTSARVAQGIAQKARAEMGIQEDQESKGLLQKILGVLTKVGQGIMSVVNNIINIIRIGGDVIQTVVNGVNSANAT